ncbi:helix-turn-helix transcriptional regulator [Paenibacillus sp. MBLB4367]|uniref:helix-turn-helix transcriptional regulator n=1 Tax=Paenibacillus sp. MBLB4367 TaxID=3384767 RepID=UPI00390836D5
MKRWITNLGLIQIFCSLLIVILTMSASTYAIYRKSISGIYEKVTQNNHLAVQSIVQAYDNSFRTIDSIIHSIQTLAPYDNLVAVDNRSLDMVKVQTVVENLAALVSSVEYIEDVVVFYDFSDLAITSKGTSSLPFLFDHKYRHDSYNANYWRSFALTKHPFKLFPADRFQIFSDANQQSKSAELLIAFSGNKVEISSKRIMVIIDMSTLLKHVNQQPTIPGSSLIVLDQEQNVVYSTEPQMNLMGILSDVYFNADNEASVTRENYKYRFYRSSYNDFIYIDKVPYQFQNIDSVSAANRMIMLSTIICAVLLAAALSFYLQRPVKRILRQLGVSHALGNDFRHILDGIVRLQQENGAYQEKLGAVDKVARRSAFLQAVDNGVPAEKHDRALHLYFDEFYRYKLFALVRLQLYEHASEELSRRTSQQITEALQARFDAAVRDAAVFYDKNAMWIVWVGMNEPRERESLLKRLKPMIASLEKEELQAHLLRASVSECYDAEAVFLPRAYQDAVNGMKYRSNDRAQKVHDALELGGGGMAPFQWESAERLSHYVADGKWDQAKTAIAEMMQRSGASQTSLHELAHIARTIFYAILRQAVRVSGKSKELQELEIDVMRQIENAYNDRVMEQALFDALEAIAKQSAKQSVRSGKPDPAYILRYIEQHHSQDLNLDQLAETMGISPKYFSHYFKKTFGVNFIEHLNMVRLSHSKKLLKETALTVVEISEKIGYLNYSTFTNTFKKYFGITPSEYRRQTADSSSEE